MDKLLIEGGARLKGDVVISGSKNSVLPILAATLLTDETCVIKSVPVLRDTNSMVKILRSLGKNVEFEKDVVCVSRGRETEPFADYKLVSTMRASFCVLGPLLAKLGRAKVSLPGGCIIGVRPVDLHLKGLRSLGAHIEVEGGYVIAKARKLKGNHIYLGGEYGSSVLATGNVLMAACLAEGRTVIESAACEPEVADLAEFLIKMGARIKGHGTPIIEVEGVRHLRGTEHRIIPDRIEAGTFMIASLMGNADITIKNAQISHLGAVVDKLKESGVAVLHGPNWIQVKRKAKLRPIDRKSVV